MFRQVMINLETESLRQPGDIRQRMVMFGKWKTKINGFSGGSVRVYRLLQWWPYKLQWNGKIVAVASKAFSGRVQCINYTSFV